MKYVFFKYDLHKKTTCSVFKFEKNVLLFPINLYIQWYSYDIFKTLIFFNVF